MDIHRVIGEIPFKPKKVFVLPQHRFTGSFNPLHLQLDNPLPGTNSIMLLLLFPCVMTCYRDNDTPAGKRECDHEKLAEVNALPKNELHKSVQ